MKLKKRNICQLLAIYSGKYKDKKTRNFKWSASTRRNKHTFLFNILRLEVVILQMTLWKFSTWLRKLYLSLEIIWVYCWLKIKQEPYGIFNNKKYFQECTPKKWWKEAGQVVLQFCKDYFMAHLNGTFNCLNFPNELKILMLDQHLRNVTLKNYNFYLRSWFPLVSKVFRRTIHNQISKMVHYGKSSIYIDLLWEYNWELGCNSIQFWDFSEIT